RLARFLSRSRYSRKAGRTGRTHRNAHRRRRQGGPAQLVHQCFGIGERGATTLSRRPNGGGPDSIAAGLGTTRCRDTSQSAQGDSLSTKFQAPSSKETPTIKLQGNRFDHSLSDETADGVGLELGPRNFTGAWMLVLGALITRSATIQSDRGSPLYTRDTYRR